MASVRYCVAVLLLCTAVLSVAVDARKKKSDDQQLVWCRAKNCFEVLGLKREDASPSVVKRTFYKLSKQYHPDRTKSPEDHEMFTKVSQAYEVLGDVDKRAEYEEFLDHPERFYKEGDSWARKHYFGEQENVWVVLAMILLIVSVGEHYYNKSRYESTRRMLCDDPVVQDRVRLLRAARGQESTQSASKLRSRKQSKRKRRDADIEINDEELMQVVNMDGFSGAPTWNNMLALRMMYWPWNTAKFVYFRVRWIVRFDILRMEYDMPEKVYLTRTRLGLSEERWNATSPDDRKNAMKRQLWNDERFAEFESNQPRKRVVRRGATDAEYDYE